MNPQHLLELAEKSLTFTMGRPRQSNLRRAVSTAYYAVFHSLTQSGARLISSREYLRPLIARKFTHASMKKTSEEFGQGKIPNSLIVPISEIPRDLAKLAQLFVRLQQERHRADYDSQASFSLAGVSDLLAETKAVLELWPALETHPAAELYLLAMLFQPLGR